MVYYDTSCGRCGERGITFLDEINDEILCDDCLEEAAPLPRPNSVAPLLVMMGLISVAVLICLASRN